MVADFSPSVDGVRLAAEDYGWAKNDDLADICEIAVRLGSPLQNDELRFTEMLQFISALKEFEPDKIPAEGLNLNDSEAANVTS